jgi:hypothetical protein
MKVSSGIYKHFKGHVYRVIGTAKHSEDLKEHIVWEHPNLARSEIKRHQEHRRDSDSEVLASD